MASIEKINAGDMAKKMFQQVGVQAPSPKGAESFDSIYRSMVQAVNTTGLMGGPKEVLPHNFNIQSKPIKVQEFDKEELKLIAQGIDPETSNLLDPVLQRIQERETGTQQTVFAEEQDYLFNKLEVTPFQAFIDKSVEVLESISQLDYRVNDLTEKFVRGEVSIDEVSVEMSKLNLAISFVTTVLSSASQTFKELTQLPM